MSSLVSSAEFLGKKQADPDLEIWIPGLDTSFPHTKTMTASHKTTVLVGAGYIKPCTQPRENPKKGVSHIFPPLLYPHRPYIHYCCTASKKKKKKSLKHDRSKQSPVSVLSHLRVEGTILLTILLIFAVRQTSVHYHMLFNVVPPYPAF